MALYVTQVHELVRQLAHIGVPRKASLLTFQIELIDGRIDETSDIHDVLQNLLLSQWSGAFS